MLWKRRPSDRLTEVRQRYNDLAKAAQGLSTKTGTVGGGPLSQVDAAASLRSSLKWLRDEVEFIHADRRIDRVIDPSSITSLQEEMKAFSKVLSRIERHLAKISNVPGAVRRARRRLGDDFRRFGATVIALQDEEENKLRRDSHYGPLLSLRDEIRRMMRGAKVESDLDVLASWCGGFGDIQLGDPRLIKRLAEIYRLLRIFDQTWVVKYRAKAPGNPLITLYELIWLPTENEVLGNPDMYGDHEVYYIGATRPKWRIVWKYQRQL